MTALGKVVRTTAFKLSAIYIAVFSVFSVVFVFYISYDRQRPPRRAAARHHRRRDPRPRRSGPRRRAARRSSTSIEQRSHQPGASLYLVTDVSGRILAGNVSRGAARPPQPLRHRPDHRALRALRRRRRRSTSPWSRSSACRAASACWSAATSASASSSARSSARRCAWALALMIGLALVSWFFVSRRVLKRIDSLSATEPADHGTATSPAGWR